MGAYRVYRNQFHVFAKQMRKKNRRMRSASESEVEKMVAQYAILDPDDHVTRRVLQLERVHRRTGSQVYFIQGTDLLNFLEQTDFQVDPATLVFPARAVSIALPANLPGMVGFLLAREDPDQLQADTHEFGTWAGHPKPLIAVAHARSRVALALENPEERDVKLYCSVPFDEIDEALQGDWLRRNVISAGVVDTDETDLQTRHLRLGLRLLAYMSAFPGQVQAGLPSDSLNVPAGLVERGTRTISLHPKLRDSPSAHLRRGHFRSLKHDRFRRDENGNVRVIYVNPSIVADQDADPFTVEVMAAPAEC